MSQTITIALSEHEQELLPRFINDGWTFMPVPATSGTPIEFVLLDNGTKGGRSTVWINFPVERGGGVPVGRLVGVEMTARSAMLALRTIAHELFRRGEMDVVGAVEPGTHQARVEDQAGRLASMLCVRLERKSEDDPRPVVALWIEKHPDRPHQERAVEPVVFAEPGDTPNTYAALIQLALAIDTDARMYGKKDT